MPALSDKDRLRQELFGLAQEAGLAPIAAAQLLACTTLARAWQLSGQHPPLRAILRWKLWNGWAPRFEPHDTPLLVRAGRR
jgi:hypothetical protein